MINLEKISYKIKRKPELALQSNLLPSLPNKKYRFAMSFFRLEQSHNRVFGLDIIRFVAIFMVLVGHSLLLLPSSCKPIISKFLLDGVAIFFVLSGFLIGGILIRQLEKEGASAKGLLKFWTRRWMRTLPAYLFILIALLIYTAIVVPDAVPHDWWRHFLFIQNLEVIPPKFFAEAWSLSVEEWFYLTVPVLVFGTMLLFRSSVKYTVLLISLLLIALISWYRFHVYYSYSGGVTEAVMKTGEFQDFVDDRIAYSVIPRLDAIMFGVFGAFIAYYFPRIWKAKVNILLLIAGVGLLYFTRHHLGSKYTEYGAVWYPLIKSFAVLLTLPALSNLKRNIGGITRFITFFSLISYSMYLTNLNLVITAIIKNGIHQNYKGIEAKYITPEERRLNGLVYITGINDEGVKMDGTYAIIYSQKDVPAEMTWEQVKARKNGLKIKEYHPSKHIVKANWIYDYILYWVLVTGLSFLLYKLVEIPFMKLRDRKTPA